MQVNASVSSMCSTDGWVACPRQGFGRRIGRYALEAWLWARSTSWGKDTWVHLGHAERQRHGGGLEAQEGG